MAYYTGSVNSYEELRTVLASACGNHGWVYNNGILSKGSAYVALKLGGTGSSGEGLMVQGGTGQSGSALTLPSPNHARLGRPMAGGVWDAVAWPASYHIHIGESPDEVYVLLNTNITAFYWLAFGRSSVPSLVGSGLWLCGSAGEYAAGGAAITISPVGGSQDASRVCNAPFWAGSRASWHYLNETIQADAGKWTSADANESLLGVEWLAPLIDRSPNAWNGESVLLPIQIYQNRPESKMRLLAGLAHARYVRLHNLEPGQVITLGADQWKVYPFYKKNASAPNGGSSLGHTGTFGWALRYEEAN